MIVQMVSIAVVGMNGSGWVDTAVIVTCVRNFPHHRGAVVGSLPCRLLRNFIMYLTSLITYLAVVSVLILINEVFDVVPWFPCSLMGSRLRQRSDFALNAFLSS
jgi:hypothetical protein